MNPKINRIRRIWGAIFILLIMQGCGGMKNLVEVRGHLPMDRRMQEALDAAVAEFKVPGAILALRDMNGKTQFWTSGTANLKSGTPMTADLHFRVGSVTKTYTATIVLQLVDEGRVRLDDPIGKYLPGLVPREDEITIRHLLEMRSGLGDFVTPQLVQVMETEPDRTLKPEELIRFVETAQPPGGEFQYRNTNYFILGLLIEEIIQSTFQKQVTRRILQPLGLTHTFIPAGVEMPEPFMRGYVFEEEKVSDGTASLPLFLVWTAGNIISTVSDQLIWAKALAEGRLLSPQASAEQFHMKPNETMPGSYGLGVMQLYGMVGHGGNFNNAYTCFVGRYHGYDLVILANGQTGDAGEGVEKTYRAIGIFRKLTQSVGL